MSVRETPAWQQLYDHYQSEIANNSLQSIFKKDEGRFERFSCSEGDFFYDYSKHRITDTTLDLLSKLLDQQDLSGWIQRMFSGDVVNTSEGRAALHTALRAPADIKTQVDGEPIAAKVHNSLDKMSKIVDQILSGQWRGYSGKPITDVVNLGVGGSDLGPLMACHALEEYRCEEAQNLRLHFASSIDGSQLAEMLHQLNQETTLFILSSKSFTTIDTLSNAEAAKRWLEQKIESEQVLLGRHFIGCSASPAKMSEFGLPEENQLLFWEWVGGRYSLWAVIGLPIALLLGFEGFKQFLAGAHAMDKHFQTKPYSENIPVLMGLMGAWSSNFLGTNGHAVLPYDGRLKYLPNYLGQLEMESNGKSVNHKGERVDYDTCPILWGEVGPNAQHAFYQLLHQGTRRVSCDFIASVNRYDDAQVDNFTKKQLKSQQLLNLANCLAQSRVLMLGDEALAPEELAGKPSDQRYEGNQVSSTLLMNELTPFNLGMLIAAYEHKVFVQAVIWEINPFDQWGVELGKKIAGETYSALRDPDHVFDDESTQGLLDFIRAKQS